MDCEMYDKLLEWKKKHKGDTAFFKNLTKGVSGRGVVGGRTSCRRTCRGGRRAGLPGWMNAGVGDGWG